MSATTITFTPRQLEIIEASAKILTYSGIGSLTIKNIAKEMQFAESAIYRHFSGKEKIVKAMLEYLAQEMDERYDRILLPSAKPNKKLKLAAALAPWTSSLLHLLSSLSLAS